MAEMISYRLPLVADHLPSGFEHQDEATGSRLLYVALTRPEDLLIMTVCQPSAFVQHSPFKEPQRHYRHADHGKADEIVPGRRIDCPRGRDVSDA